MTNIKAMSRKLRDAADALDALLREDETATKARQIVKAVRKYGRRGLHWTQRPENRAKKEHMLRKVMKARMAKRGER